MTTFLAPASMSHRLGLAGAEPVHEHDVNIQLDPTAAPLASA